MKPRIAYVITRAETGGGQIHVLDLLAGFHSAFDLHLITGESGFLTLAAEDLGVRSWVVPSLVQPMAPAHDLKALVDVMRLLGEIRPDLVHAHTSKAGFIARAAAGFRNIPSVFTAHTWCFAEGTSATWKLVGTPLERVASRFCRKIIAVSEANRQLAIRSGIPGDKIRTIHNGIPDGPERAKPYQDDGPVRVIMTARFARQKDQAALLYALEALQGRVEAYFAGDGPLRPEMESLAARLRVTQWAHFLGDRRDIAELLASSHIFALPTRWEGFPLSILEAMRTGLPVIASDVGGVSEAVHHGVTGYVTRAGDYADFTEKLRLLVESPERRREFGNAGRASYVRNFTRQAMIKRTLEVYQEAVPHWKNQTVPVFQETLS